MEGIALPATGGPIGLRRTAKLGGTSAVKTILAAVAIAAGLAICAPAQAAYVVNVVESGPGEITFTGSGSFDLIGLAFNGPSGAFNATTPSEALLSIGKGLGHPPVDQYSGVIGGSPFGPAPQISFNIDNMEGTFISLKGSNGTLFVPRGYVSGTELGVSRNITSGTFASRGLTVGTYVWRLGQSPDADTFTLNIVGGVPEPSTWAMLILGAGMSGAAIRRRRTRLA